MDDPDEDTSTSGFITPPELSPTKSTSTCTWSSPPTPTSPRKAQSCFSFRGIAKQDHPGKSPEYPGRSLAIKLSALRSPESHAILPNWYEDAKGVFDSDDSHLQQDATNIRSNNRSDPNQYCRSNHGPIVISDSATLHKSAECRVQKSLAQPSSHDLVEEPRSAQSLTSPSPKTPGPSFQPMTLQPPATPDTHTQPTKLARIPIRSNSSPLRPGQWAARGGLLSPPRSQTRTPDRFISSRRPPHVTRESFELNKPTSRLSTETRDSSSFSPSVDPFSRRLRRSGRMNDELRSLREAHSALTSRANLVRNRASVGIRRTSSPLGLRRISAGAVWNVGGTLAVSDTVVGVPTGRGGTLGSGTNAPLYTSMFLNRSDPDAELEAYERRVALALDVDQADRILGHRAPTSDLSTPSSPIAAGTPGRTRHVWRDNEWTRDGDITLLDAPQLRDDYYCSLIAYSQSAQCLAVGLGNFVHLWSERKGVDTPASLNTMARSEVQHVTSLAFSSVQGGQAILAVGRADGRLSLWSPFDLDVRFNAEQPKPVSCVSFRPTLVKRPSQRDGAMLVPTEELLVGDEMGHIYFYSVEWPGETESALFDWNGALTLLVRMNFHSQQICGLSWSFDGELFASGGNDNACCLFETKKILQNHADLPSSNLRLRYGPSGESILTVSLTSSNDVSSETYREKHRWELNAAIKAIAFCPWQRGLLAISGGSNDRCIHFYHAFSGACLATIDCAAQVTSLIWSSTRKEIAATFGFAQPEHPFRVAVFAWPTCEQIVAIPWYDENRALFAVPYPGGPITHRDRGEDGVWWSRGREEGCIVVATSDAAIRFHEIWTEDRRGLGSGAGLLGGSEILENLHGIERASEQVIR